MKLKSQLTMSIALILANFSLFYLPPLNLIIYPFVILSTWFHEMGHGVTALLLGGSFSHLEIFSNGAGIAHISIPSNLGRIGQALIALNGPLFPPIFGYIFISNSKKTYRARLLLFLFSILIFVSNIIWVRSTFGFITLLVLAIIIFIASLSKKDKLHFLISQVIGIQAFLAVYLSIGYLFSKNGDVNQSSLISDTELVARSLYLPYWFWAIFIIAFSIFLFYRALRSLKVESK